MTDTRGKGGPATYVDSNVFIFLIEDTPGKADKVARVFTELAEAGGSLVTSELTVAECCFKPARDKNTKLVSVYEDLLEKSGEVRLVPLTGDMAKKAVFVGAELGLKLLDSIHYTSALEASCAQLITGDFKFKTTPALRVVQL